MDEYDRVDKTEASLKASQKKYYASPKGKAKKAEQNRNYRQKIKQITITFTEENKEIYDYLKKNKGDRKLNEIALEAFRDWIVRSL
jgi:hypothetical protein